MVVVSISSPIVITNQLSYLSKLPEGAKPSDFIIRGIPHIRWKHVEPCSKYIDTQEQWNQAVECSAEVFNGEEIKKLREAPLPRCYVIKEDTPGVFKSYSSNHLALYDRDGSFGATMGLYFEGEELMLLVENIDVLDLYRHESQHHMFTVLGKSKEDRGLTVHTHKIWKECMPPLHTPSRKSEEVYGKRELSKSDIVMLNLMKSSNTKSSPFFILSF